MVAVVSPRKIIDGIVNGPRFAQQNIGRGAGLIVAAVVVFTWVAFDRLLNEAWQISPAEVSEALETLQTETNAPSLPRVLATYVPDQRVIIVEMDASRIEGWCDLDAIKHHLVDGETGNVLETWVLAGVGGATTLRLPEDRDSIDERDYVVVDATGACPVPPKRDWFMSSPMLGAGGPP